MTRYGFRLYEVGLRKRLGRKDLPWRQDGWSYLKHVKDGLDKIKDSQQATDDGTRPAPISLGYGKTDIRDLDELPLSAMDPSNSSDKEHRVGRVEDSVVAGRQLSFALKAGNVGQFDDSIGLAADRPMRNEAAALSYRAELVVPEDEHRGLLALETIGRFSPITQALCLLTLASREAGGWGDSDWWTLHCDQVTDPEFLNEVLEGGNAEVHLRRIRRDPQGKKEAVDRHLIFGVHDIEELERTRRWAKLTRKSRKDLGTRGLVNIVEADEDILRELEFNDGYVTIGDKVKTKVRMDDALDRFTYPINTTARPTASVWREAVRERMSVVDETLFM